MDEEERVEDDGSEGDGSTIAVDSVVCKILKNKHKNIGVGVGFQFFLFLFLLTIFFSIQDANITDIDEATENVESHISEV